jgi:hypothetical protein
MIDERKTLLSVCPQRKMSSISLFDVTVILYLDQPERFRPPVVRFVVGGRHVTCNPISAGESLHTLAFPVGKGVEASKQNITLEHLHPYILVQTKHHRAQNDNLVVYSLLQSMPATRRCCKPLTSSTSTITRNASARARRRAFKPPNQRNSAPKTNGVCRIRSHRLL